MSWKRLINVYRWTNNRGISGQQSKQKLIEHFCQVLPKFGIYFGPKSGKATKIWEKRQTGEILFYSMFQRNPVKSNFSPKCWIKVGLYLYKPLQIILVYLWYMYIWYVKPVEMNMHQTLRTSRVKYGLCHEWTSCGSYGRDKSNFSPKSGKQD